MAALPILYGESTFFRLVTTTLTEGKIATIDAKTDFSSVKVDPSYPAPASTAEVQYHTTTGANNNRYSVPDKSKNFNVLDGTEISEASGDSTFKLTGEVMVSPAQYKTLTEAFLSGDPVFGICDIGKDAQTEAIAGYEYLLGRITELTITTNPGPTPISFTLETSKTISFIGGEAPPDYTDFNTVATGITNKLTPTNEAELTITELVKVDWDKLIVGEIVTKYVGG